MSEALFAWMSLRCGGRGGQPLPACFSIGGD
jgi:hypothetical protein